MMPSRVDLPQPEGPTSTMTSPGSAVREICRKRLQPP